ncbi:hypothetical protein, partial [Paracoccus sp. FO-3]|uniref:hypothetical protein n=1 Tax=Paracoccus sp. FO-3 TaxID=1335059 RepID=UPI001C6161CD
MVQVFRCRHCKTVGPGVRVSPAILPRGTPPWWTTGFLPLRWPGRAPPIGLGQWLIWPKTGASAS